MGRKDEENEIKKFQRPSRKRKEKFAPKLDALSEDVNEEAEAKEQEEYEKNKPKKVPLLETRPDYVRRKSSGPDLDTIQETEEEYLDQGKHTKAEKNRRRNRSNDQDKGI